MVCVDGVFIIQFMSNFKNMRKMEKKVFFERVKAVVVAIMAVAVLMACHSCHTGM